MVYILIIMFLVLIALSVSTNLLASKVATEHGFKLKRKFFIYTDMQDIIQKLDSTDDEDLRKSLSKIVKMKMGIKLLQIVAVILFVYYMYSGSWQS